MVELWPLLFACALFGARAAEYTPNEKDDRMAILQATTNDFRVSA